MKLFRHTYKRRAALVTLLVHVLLVGVFYSYGLTYMDPKIEEGIAIEFGYVEEGFGEEITQTEEIQTEIIEEVLETEAAAPIEEPTVSEEIITQDIEFIKASSPIFSRVHEFRSSVKSLIKVGIIKKIILPVWVIGPTII